MNMDEVIVYQMGKVGSTSIVTALDARGVKAHQSHFLDTATFQEMADRITKSGVSEQAAFHMSHQLQRNLMVANRLARFSAGLIEEGSIRVITLARDPLDWFYSNLLQNYFTYEQMLDEWLHLKGYQQPGEAMRTSHITRFVGAVCRSFMENVEAMNADAIKGIQAAFRAGNGTREGRISRFIHGEATGLLRPHFWFDRHFKSVFGVDVLEPGIEAGQSFRDASGKIEILLLKFERLAEEEALIGQFCELSDFHLQRDNVSTRKPLASLFREARSEMVYPDGFMALLYSSGYCRKFYPGSGG